MTSRVEHRFDITIERWEAQYGYRHDHVVKCSCGFDSGRCPGSDFERTVRQHRAQAIEDALGLTFVLPAGATVVNV